MDLIGRVLTAAVAELPPRDRLRLRCYYAEDLTLAQIGATLAEHEATVSRNLTRTRRSLRARTETVLRVEQGMGEAEIDECFSAVAQNSGPLDIAEMLGSGPEDRAHGLSYEASAARKEVAPDRSK